MARTSKVIHCTRGTEAHWETRASRRGSNLGVSSANTPLCVDRTGFGQQQTASLTVILRISGYRGVSPHRSICMLGSRAVQAYIICTQACRQASPSSTVQVHHQRQHEKGDRVLQRTTTAIVGHCMEDPYLPHDTSCAHSNSSWR